MEKIRKGVLKKFLIYFFIMLIFATGLASATTPALTSISVGNSTVYIDAWHSWQEQQLANSSASDAENGPLTLICCDDNTNSCVPSVDNAVCIDYKSAPYDFVCSYEPNWNFPPNTIEDPSIEEIRHLRCSVNDSTGNSPVVSTSYITSFDCQDGSESPVLPALAGSCHLRKSLTLVATPEYGFMVEADTPSVTLDCDDKTYDITGAEGGVFIAIYASDVKVQNCEITNGPILIVVGGENAMFWNNKLTYTSIDKDANVGTLTVDNNEFYNEAFNNPQTEALLNKKGIAFELANKVYSNISITNNKFYALGGTGLFGAIKGNGTRNSVVNINIQNNYFEDSQVLLDLNNTADVNVNGTVIIEGNTWLGTMDKPLINFLDANALYLRGGQVDYVFKNNNISKWYNKSAYWDEDTCGSGYPVPVNAPGWFCGVEGIAAIFGQFAKSIKIENNDFKDIQGYVAFLRNVNANGITVYDNEFVDASGIYVRDSNGANITYNSITETTNITVVEPVIQSLSRFCYFRNANAGICRDNTLTSNHGVLFRAREAVNNTDVSFNTFNYIDIPGLEHQGNATHDAYYYWGGDVNNNALFQIRGRAGRNIIQNNTINDLPDGDYSFEVASNGIATNPEIRGTDNEFKYNVFNENVNEFNYELNGALDNIVDDPGYPNYWKKSPVVVSVNCTDAAQPDAAVCEALVEDVRWYDMIGANASIKKGEVVIESDDETFMDYVSLYQHRYNFTFKPTGEGLWTANATITDFLGGVAEGNTTFFYTYYSTPPEISIDNQTFNEDLISSEITLDLSAYTVDPDNNTKTELTYDVVSQSNTLAADCEIVNSYVLNCTLLSIGETEIVVNASDGFSIDDETFTIKINDVPNITNFSASSLNRTDVSFMDTGAVVFDENETIRFEANITDVDDSTHWYTWIITDVWGGLVKIVTTLNNFFEWATGFFTAQDGPYNITVIVNDSNNAQVVQEWSVNVTDINGPPSFNESLQSQEVIYDRSGETRFIYDVNCSDPDNNDTIMYYDNTDKFDINPSDGMIDWLPLQNDTGIYEVEITCSDGNYNVSQSFNVYVTAWSDLSVSSGDISFSDNNPDTGDEVWISAVVYNLGDVDAENVDVKFYDGTTFIGSTTVSVPKYFNNKNTTQISWTPTENGTHVIKVSVNEPPNPKEISYDNNKATKAIRVGQLIIGGIIVDAGSLTPNHALTFASVRVSGHAYYNTTFGLGENVAGASVTVTIDDLYAGSGRTLNDGTFNFYVTVPDLSPDNYEYNILVDDATLTGERTGNFTVDIPPYPKPDLYISKIYSEPKKPLDNATVDFPNKLKADIRNVGNLDAYNVLVKFVDNNNNTANATIPYIGVKLTETANINWSLPDIGPHTIIVTADPDNTVDELNENNNERSNNIKVFDHAQHKPDLEPEFWLSTEQPYRDEPFNITVKVYNRGVVDAQNVKIQVYDEYEKIVGNITSHTKDPILPPDTTIDFIPADPSEELDGYKILDPIGYKFTAETVPPYNHSLTVEIDDLDEISEVLPQGELNNNISKPITVKERIMEPDFVPISLTFSKTNPKVGEEIITIATIKNQGRESRSTNISFFIDEGNEMVADELYIGGRGGINSTSVNIIINESGTYNIKVAADPKNEIDERLFPEAELNNNLTQQLTVYPYLAELRTFSEYINFSDDYPDEGSNLTVTVKVENLGEISASNFTVTLDRDGGYIADIVPNSVVIDSLGVNSNVPVEFTWVNVTGNGSHVIRARVNPEHTVQESNYADNDATRSVIVGDFADFYVLDDDVVFNDTLEVNKSVRMDVTVHNGGTIEGSAVVKIYDGSTLLHNETITVNYDNSTVVSTDWMPKKFDNVLIIEIVEVTPAELDYTDNSLIKNVHINVAPVLKQNIPDISFDEDNSTVLTMNDYFKDDNDPVLNYTYASNDNGVKIEFTGAYIKYANISTTEENWYGSALVSITAFDDEGANVVSNNFVVTVNPVNDAPYFIESLTDQTTLANEPFIYDVNCSDVDSEVTYYNNDSEVGINSSTGLITWTPTNVEVRSAEITCADWEFSISQIFNINVLYCYDSDSDNICNDEDICLYDNTNTCLDNAAQQYVNYSEGDSLSTPNSDVALIIPPSALAEDMVITVVENETKKNYYVSGPGGVAQLQTTYYFTPEGLTFLQPVNITMSYDQPVGPECGAKELNLDIWYYNSSDDTYTALNAEQDCSMNTLTAEVTHFSDYEVILLNSPPYFVENLTSQEAIVGEQFSYDVNCSNLDGDSISYYDNATQFEVGLTDGLISWTPAMSDVGLLSVEVACTDNIENVSQSFNINVTDITPPMITDIDSLNGTTFPDGTTQVKVNVTTDEVAYCEYSAENMSFAFGEGAPFEITNSFEHSFTYLGLTDGSIYNISVKCNDSYNNFNVEDWFVSFNVPLKKCAAEMVSYWKLDENNGSWAYDSISDNDGNISGAIWADGKVNTGLSFDGSNDYVSCGNDTSLNIGDGVTLMAWIYPTERKGADIIIKKDAYQLLIHKFGNKVYSAGSVSIGGSEKFVNSQNTDSKLALNEWALLTFAYNGSDLKLYHNTVEVDSKPQTGNIDISSNGLRLGGYYAHLAGSMDEATVYNRSLTIEEINQHYDYAMRGKSYCEI